MLEKGQAALVFPGNYGLMCGNAQRGKRDRAVFQVDFHHPVFMLSYGFAVRL